MEMRLSDGGAGFFGGVIDAVLSRILDVIWAFPIFLLAISLSIVGDAMARPLAEALDEPGAPRASDGRRRLVAPAWRPAGA